MPRWNSCYIDKRAIKNIGCWGEYICDKCGKKFIAKMSAKKKAKHIFCSTKCKKDGQVKCNRQPIPNNIYRVIYNDNYNVVKREAFKVLSNKNLYLLEDCMQLGFIELWKIYNRNKMDCGKLYIQKSVRHAILDVYRYWKKQESLYIASYNEEMGA